VKQTHAIALMVFSMAGFAVADSIVKISSVALSSAQIILFMAVIGGVIFAAFALRARQPLWSPLILTPTIVLRNLAESVGAICMVTALGKADLSLVISITQANPLLVVLGAALVLRETVGPRRWIAVIVGLGGVLLMLRPSTDGIEIGALWALGAAIALAVRDITARMAPPEASNFQLATWAMVALALTSLAMMLFDDPQPAIPLDYAAVMGCGALIMALAYYAITAAMRTGEVSAVIPFRYSRLIFAFLIGVLFLGETIDLLTILGAGIVIGSGLFILMRERQLSKRG